MEPTKAKELLQLNVNEAGNQMPSDIKTALIMGISAITRVLDMRFYNINYAKFPLIGEIPIPDLSPSADRKQKLRESPLGREPKG